jgi:general secretion pathway protein K
MAGPGRLTRGVVLLTTLLILALLAAYAWQMVGRHTLLIAQYRQGFTGDQALTYALGAETFARQILFQDWSEGGTQKDTLQEMWAQAPPPFEVENGSIEIQARDLQGCFNLNSVASGRRGPGPGEDGEDQGDPSSGMPGIDETEPSGLPERDGLGPGAPGVQQQRLRQLLRNLGLPDALADQWRDWVDVDLDPSGFGAEDGDYLSLDPAYRTANGRAADISEFRLLRDLEPDMYDAVEGSLCVLPNDDLKLNVNTARPEVLASLSAAQELEPVARFAEGPRDLADVSQFTQLFPDLAGAVDALTVSSEYFEVSIRARVDDASVELVSVLRRDPSNGRIELISRDLSRNFRSLFMAELDARDDTP